MSEVRIRYHHETHRSICPPLSARLAVVSTPQRPIPSTSVRAPPITAHLVQARDKHRGSNHRTLFKTVTS